MRIILKNILRRKLRSLFALLGVAMGILAMVSLTAITRGTIYQFKRLVTDYRGDIIVQQLDAPDPAFSQLDLNLVPKLKSLEEVKAVHPIAFTATKIPGDEFFFILGLEPDSALLKRHSLLSGRYFSTGKGEMILGKDAAQQYHKKVGDSFLLHQKEFTIVGIYQLHIRFMDKACILALDDLFSLNSLQQGLSKTSDFLKKVGVAPLKEAVSTWFTPSRKVNMIVLDLHDKERDSDKVVQAIPLLYPGYEAFPSPNYLNNFEQVELVEAMALVISIITMAIAALGILNTMMMSIYERTREIGLLRSLGWSSRRILGMILGEGVVLSFFGCLLGIAGGVLATEIVIKVVNVGLLHAYYPLELFGEAFLFSLCMGFFGALFPAWKAISIAPVEALRYE
jgi:putative ABC transport system permease protein